MSLLPQGWQLMQWSSGSCSFILVNKIILIARQSTEGFCPVQEAQCENWDLIGITRGGKNTLCFRTVHFPVDAQHPERATSLLLAARFAVCTDQPGGLGVWGVSPSPSFPFPSSGHCRREGGKHQRAWGGLALIYLCSDMLRANSGYLFPSSSGTKIIFNTETNYPPPNLSLNSNDCAWK